MLFTFYVVAFGGWKFRPIFFRCSKEKPEQDCVPVNLVFFFSHSHLYFKLSPHIYCHGNAHWNIFCRLGLALFLPAPVCMKLAFLGLSQLEAQIRRSVGWHSFCSLLSQILISVVAVAAGYPRLCNDVSQSFGGKLLLVLTGVPNKDH